jgi:hypothetical protein
MVKGSEGAFCGAWGMAKNPVYDRKITMDAAG